jgi:hypothetical protein
VSSINQAIYIFLSLHNLLFPVFATTAANPHESSYATYWDEKRETYLGDLYSIAWMEDSDKVRLHLYMRT